jgi:hypothetical protein
MRKNLAIAARKNTKKVIVQTTWETKLVDFDRKGRTSIHVQSRSNNRGPLNRKKSRLKCSGTSRRECALRHQSCENQKSSEITSAPILWKYVRGSRYVGGRTEAPGCQAGSAEKTERVSLGCTNSSKFSQHSKKFRKRSNYLIKNCEFDNAFLTE